MFFRACCFFFFFLSGSGASFDYDSSPSRSSPLQHDASGREGSGSGGSGSRRGGAQDGGGDDLEFPPPAPSPLGKEDVHQFVTELVKEVVGRCGGGGRRGVCANPHMYA